MTQYKLSFRNRSVPEQLGICERVIANLQRATPEQCANVDVPAVQAAVTAARTSQERVLSLKAELRAEMARRKALLHAARTRTTCACAGLAANVSSEPVAMLAAGLELARPKVPVGKPIAPQSVRVAADELEGVARLRWKHPLRRCTYEVQMRAESAAENDWQPVQLAVRQSCVAKQLSSGVKYFFRLRAHNAHGHGPWSQTVAVRVK